MKKRHIYFALEEFAELEQKNLANQEPEDTVTSGDELVPLAAIDDPEEIVENDLLCIQAEKQALENMIEDIGEAQEVLQTLDEIQKPLKEAADQNGLMRVEAQILNDALEDLLERIGEGDVTLLPAMEAFGGTMSRKDATRLTCENFKEFLRTAWDKLIAIIKNAIHTVSEYLRNFFNRQEARIQRCKRIISDLKDFDEEGAPLSAKTFKLSDGGTSLGQFLSFNDPELHFGELTTGLRKYMAAASMTQLASWVERASKKVSDIIESPLDRITEDAVDAAIKEIRTGFLKNDRLELKATAHAIVFESDDASYSYVLEEPNVPSEVLVGVTSTSDLVDWLELAVSMFESSTKIGKRIISDIDLVKIRLDRTSPSVSDGEDGSSERQGLALLSRLVTAYSACVSDLLSHSLYYEYTYATSAERLAKLVIGR